MEHNGSNQNLAAGSLCRAGCGFYGNAAFEGMCSKCFKDAVKRRQQNPTPTQVGSGRISPATPNSHSSSVDVSASSSPTVDPSAVSLNNMTMGTSTLSIASRTTPSVDTATPTIPSASSSAGKTETNDKAESETAGAEANSPGKDKDGSGEKKPKKNRCHSCKKKVGLTGFECRCGGLYCSLHRYSDKHECTFNYKEMAQEQIRKNNPVVVGEKIQKI